MAPFPDPLLRDDLYEAPQFVNTKSIEVLTNRPRFGYHSDITVMFDRTASQEEQTDYVKGVVLFSVVGIAIHAVWFIILLVLRCLGPNRVGVWSGFVPKNMHKQKRRYSKQASATDDKEQFKILESSEDKNTETQPEKHKLNSADKTHIIQSQEDEEKEKDDEELEERIIEDTQQQQQQQRFSGSDRIQITPSQDDDEEKVEVVEQMQEEAEQEESKLNGDDNAQMKSQEDDKKDDIDPKELEIEEDQHEKQKVDGADRTEIQTQEDDSKEEGPNHDDDDDDEEEEEEAETVQKVERILKCFRITTWIAGTLMICFAIIFMDKGIRSLNNGMDAAQQGLLDVHNISMDGVDIIQSYLDITDRIATGLTEGLLIDWCPNQQEKVCDTNYQGEDLVGLVLVGLCGTSNNDTIDRRDEPEFVKDLRSLQRDLEKLAESALTAYEKLYTFTWSFWVAFSFCWLLCMVTIGRMQMTYLAAKKESKYIHESRIRCLLGVPIWFFLMVCFGVFEAVFLIGGIVSSDFCYDSPDPNVLSCLSMIHGIGYDVTKTIEWYILGCEGESPLQESYGDYLISIIDGIATAHEIFYGLQLKFDGSHGDIEEFCGKPVLESKFQDVDGALHYAFDALTSTREYFFCETFNPLYTNLAYDSICYEMVSGFRWVSVAAMMVTNMALLMATVRAGSEIQLEEEESTEENDSDVSSHPIATKVEGEVDEGWMEDSKLDGGRQASQSTQFFSAREHSSPGRTKSEESSVI